MKKPNFSPEHPHLYPIKKIGKETIITHCQEHQQAFPSEGQAETPEMIRIRNEIEALRISFQAKVSTGLCEECSEKKMKEIEEYFNR